MGRVCYWITTCGAAVVGPHGENAYRFSATPLAAAEEFEEAGALTRLGLSLASQLGGESTSVRENEDDRVKPSPSASPLRQPTASASELELRVGYAG